ncbi:3'(2'),5'-bisphosphate nucleotidase CysQ family protein [Cyclobacterium jeungdonense]|uniref:Inositol monophosphatase family protein n=1 Tax=Cyclobacterium jeungdonense TaxID=708087 RepID=A0ABT8CCE2_9BACT|nr:inositol monophosphatase family protein [Cyclobacterium jeungdonense]MDN3690176.1 inositol monophosphatase family protein [Cyclobacterium jeungdonense]
MLNKRTLSALCQSAVKASIEAGQLIQSQVDQPYQQHEKEAGYSLASQVVTEVDFKAQELILKHLRPGIAQYDLGLLTEEAADDQTRLHKDYFWCIDPLDGTLPFTEQRPGYAVSIALISQSGDPVIGVVYIPDEDLCYSAVRGEGLALNGQAFDPGKVDEDKKFHIYMDRSMQSGDYFDPLTEQIKQWAKAENYGDVLYHIGFGAVRNALSVMSHKHAGYFKFPRSQKGGGSIWDFAATRLIFEELGLPVSNMKGEKLHLNSPETTFMHRQGVVYATTERIAEMVLRLEF